MDLFNSELRRRALAGGNYGTAQSAYSQPTVQYGSSLGLHQATGVVHPTTTYDGTAQSVSYSQPIVQYGSSLGVHQATGVVHPTTSYEQYQVLSRRRRCFLKIVCGLIIEVGHVLSFTV